MIENDPTILGEGETIENHKEKWPNVEKQLMTAYLRDHGRANRQKGRSQEEVKPQAEKLSRKLIYTYLLASFNILPSFSLMYHRVKV